MRNRKAIAFLFIILAVSLSVYVTISFHYIGNVLNFPVTVVPQVSFNATDMFEIRHVQKVLINGTEFLIVDYRDKIAIVDIDGSVIAEENKEESSSIKIVYDLDRDGFSEILMIERSDIDSFVLRVLDYRFNVLAEIEISYPYQVKIGDVDGDNCFEIVIMESISSKPGGSVIVSVYEKDGTLLNEYHLAIEDLYKQDYALEASLMEISDINNDGVDDIIVVAAYTRYLGENRYINEFRTYLTLISKGSIIWTKVCNVGNFFSFPILDTFDIDMDSYDEILLIGATEYAKEEYDQTILIFDVDGKLIGQSRIIGLVDYVFLCNFNNDTFYDLALIYYVPSDKYYYKVLDVKNNSVLFFRKIEKGTIKGVFYEGTAVLNPIIVMINESELILLRSNFSRLVSRRFEGSRINVISLIDVNYDGFTEIVVEKIDKEGERYLHAISANGSDIYYFPVNIPFSNILVIKRQKEPILAIYYSNGIAIYRSNGELLSYNVSTSFDLITIPRKVLYEDVDYDNKYEIVIVSSFRVYIYDYESNALKSFYIPTDFPELDYNVVFADINADGSKEIILYRSVLYGTSTEEGLKSELYCLSQNGSLIFEEYSINETEYYKIAVADIDNDERDELVVLESEFLSPNILRVRVIDDNGATKLTFEINERDPNSIIAFRVIKLREEPSIFIFTKYTQSYKLSLYSLNGSVIWEFSYLHYYGNKVLASLFYDVDEDGVEEFIFSSFEVNHMLRCVKIGVGELWSVELDNPNISDVIEYKGTRDYIYPIELPDGRKAIEINYILYETKQNYLRYLIISTNGEIIFDEWLIVNAIKGTIHSVATLPRITYINGKLYCVAILADFSLVTLGFSKYSALIYGTSEKQSVSFHLLSEKEANLGVIDIDNDNRLEIILVGNSFILIYEITSR